MSATTCQHCGTVFKAKGTRMKYCTHECFCAERRVGDVPLKQHPLHEVWRAMCKRCFNKNHRSYSDYGGRGISVFPAWCSFWVFARDIDALIGPRPRGYSIDRYPNNDGNYEPGNVRWATHKEQQRNRRANRLVTMNGVTKPAVVWAEDMGVNRGLIYDRLNRGWTVERALTQPVRAYS